MKKTNIVMHLVLLAGMFMVFYVEADACECRAMPPVAESLDNAEIVMTARVTSVDGYITARSADKKDVTPTTKLIVERVFKGNVKQGDEIIIQPHPGRCDRLFDKSNVGQEYLYFLPKPESSDPATTQPIFSQTICDRITKLENAGLDLEYLENVEKYRGRTRVSGRIRPDIWGSQAGSTAFPSIDGIEIDLKSKAEAFSAKTASDGGYEFFDLTAGTYALRARVPKGWKVNEEEFTLEDGKQLEIPLMIEADTLISGRLLSADGRPMGDIRVSVIAVDRQMSRYDIGILDDRTNPNGEFEIDALPAGQYVLAANVKEAFQFSNANYDTVYYPGVRSRERAAIINVEMGKPVTGLSLRMFARKPSVEVKGIVKYSDGVPAVGALVSFSSEDRGSGSVIAQSYTDETGNFTLRVLKGAVGDILVLEADTDSFSEACKAERLKKDPVSGSTEFLMIKNVPVNAAKDVSGIDLKFPYSSCTGSEQKK